MILEPPGEPVSRTGAPSRRTTVGAIDERGRLPPSTRFATGAPSTSGSRAKSVSSLLSRKPPLITREPKLVTIVVVAETMSP